MNIILLSGGSGKRLWPLSNDTRSKQFLKLMKNPAGQYESMLQRVYRQIREVGIQSPVIIATSRDQQDSIKSQLGESVEIVIEPEKRDTFPAIALSSMYLSMEKGCSPDEAVIVIPVDTYAGNDFFNNLLTLEKMVSARTANLILLGIEPTYPSEKYGYILPAEDQSRLPYKVIKFIEKPSANKAKELIEMGALWNGGIFAFRLQYILDIIKKYTQPKDFEEMLANYSILVKNSFDYEIVENATSIAVVPYKGLWKDLGTWNTLTEEMANENIGKVLTGEENKNTNIINELNIPVVVLGAENMIVAASPDGILVANKNKSSYLKPYVDQIDQRPMFVERIWGTYEVLNYSAYSDKFKSLTKNIILNPGKSISYQSHELRDEIWIIVDGCCDILIDGHIRNAHRGDVAYITKGEKHAIKAVNDLHFIEVQIGEKLEETDIIRYEWEW